MTPTTRRKLAILGIVLLLPIFTAAIMAPKQLDIFAFHPLTPTGLAMAIRIKPVEKIAEKWKAKASAASGDYKEGLSFPKHDQAEAAIAAEESYNSGVTEAIARGAFVKGVEAAGSAKWKNKSETVGAQRFTGGVTAAVDDFKKGVTQSISVLSGLDLPPRMPKGNPANLERVRIVNEALRKAATT